MTTRKMRYLHGVSRLLVLKLLAEREMYGYELGQALRSMTDDVITLGEGMIYPLLHELEEGGLLKSRRDRANGRPRVYYRVTAKGRRRLERDADAWWSVARAIAHVLGEDKHGTALA